MTEYSQEEKLKFVESIKLRTKGIALKAIGLSKEIPKSEEGRIISRQLIRSATSVGANYRAACRGRSKAEYFAKLSITVEETDETLYWLEIREESGLIQFDLSDLKNEVIEVLSILSKARKNSR